MKKLSIFLILFLVFMPKYAFADTSISYQFLTSMMTICEQFILTLFDALALSFKPIFYIIATIVLVIHSVKIIFGKLDIIALIKLFIMIIVVNVLVFQSGVFEKFFYRPIMTTVYKLPTFVIRVSSGSKSSDANTLKGMFIDIDNTIARMRAVGEMVMEEKSVFTSLWMWLQGAFMSCLYLGLYCVFVVMFTMGIIASHVMLALSPFAICFLAFPQLRGFSFNVLRAFCAYALIPFFASIAMGITLSSMTGIMNEAQVLLANNNASEVPDSFFVQAILIGVFSWFFHLKSSEFASQAVGGAISNFGQAFATGVGMVAGASQTLAGRVGIPIAGAVVSKGVPLVRSGIRTTRNVYGKARDWAREKNIKNE